MNKTFNRSRDDKPGSYRTHYDCKYTIDKHKMLSLTYNWFLTYLNIQVIEMIIICTVTPLFNQQVFSWCHITIKFTLILSIVYSKIY